ncbi:hypothetical protein F4604DRAFT_1674426 [Suillus subluteus]|nr:hypothetical protein F4604DRAFT_1674426 [Suillus subluteus]
MPALVAHAEEHSYFPPPALSPCRRYETRNVRSVLKYLTEPNPRTGPVVVEGFLMQFTYLITDQIVTPYLTITLTSVDGPTEFILIPALGECALSEDREHVFDKMDKELQAHPKAVLVMIVLIHEAKSYTSPPVKSIASITLRNGDEDDPFPLPLRPFIRQQSMPRSFNHAVTVASHQWCQVQSLEYFVWTKGTNGPIDVYDFNPAHMAHASWQTLVPEKKG